MVIRHKQGPPPIRRGAFFVGRRQGGDGVVFGVVLGWWLVILWVGVWVSSV